MSSPRGEQEPIRRESGAVSAALVVSAAPIAVAVESARAQAYADASRSKATYRAYSSDWRCFAAWCSERGADAGDAKPDDVASYLAWMADSGYTAKTIGRAYNGISWHLRAVDPVVWRKGDPPEPVILVLAGIRRVLAHCPLAKDAITLAELRAMLPHVGAGLHGVRNRALVLVGFYCAMRRSELVALDAEDVVIDRTGLRARTRRSKTDQEGHGLERHAAHTEDQNVCAPCTLHRWVKAAHIQSGPIFRPIAGDEVGAERLGACVVTRALQEAARRIGLDPARIGAHSLRAGYVTTAAKNGKSLTTIMKQTGHTSPDQVRAYIRHPSVWDDNATENLK